MKRSQFVLFVLVLVSLFLVVGCGSGSGVTGEAIAVGSQEVKIGVLLPLSGDGANYGENIKNGVELALEGSGFEVVYEDGGCNVDDAVDGVEKLIDEGVVGIIGELCSDSTLVAIGVAKDAGVAMISPASIDFDLSNTPEVAEKNTVLGNQFFKKYKKAYGSEPPAFSAEAFDAGLVLNEAVLNSDGSREGVMNAIKDISFEGASGSINFEGEYYFLK
ncbi:MAG: ABC transporter substrate-binding protein [Candidatus Woesearchaeota archaeon]